MATHPHDTSSFTQGLLWFDGLLYESTGLRGLSVLRIIDLPSGRVLQEMSADPQHFGEGLALVDDQLIWLTWQAGTAGVYQRNTLEQTGSFAYAGEGWGLCHDGARPGDERRVEHAHFPPPGNVRGDGLSCGHPGRRQPG